ncbi:alpha/beta fold hydrolase [Algoriphagus halophilus]|uniref:Pimeloyl-ACP methyl ester carboxylesterase n=1 Tax=Algoriphagus halophilus TaxID=226505 RepID=A0A1N6H3F3_9BACT|nr:alpha/beta hydrolase [Algoriphagus halophilus]SIO14300.1 Pimeloyl-ACP methyl ester carboxylesterase [Algoriphagus halophilus]
MKHFFTFVFLAFLFIFQASAQERFVELNGYKIWINTIGIEQREEGQPLVIFESGHGTPMGNWDKVIESVAEFAPILTYDRPGIGKSEATDYMPTLKNVSEQLVRLLDKLEFAPPYILVGHSLGGVYVRGFANYYPEKLAGLVIIDPGDFTETHQNRTEYYDILDWEPSKVDSLIQSFIDIRASRNKDSPAPIKREGQVLEELREQDFQEISGTPLPNIPVHMVVGGRFDMPVQFQSKEYDDKALFRSKIKHRISRWTDVIQSVDKGMLLYSGDAGHFVQWDDPELVISSIRIVMQDYYTLQEEMQQK